MSNGKGQAVAEKIGDTGKRRQLTMILMGTLVAAYLDRVNVSVLLADEQFLLAMGLTGAPERMGLLMTAFLAMYALGNVCFGFLGDRIGPRKAMSLSVLLWSPAMFLGGLSNDLYVLIGSRMFLGACEGLHWPMQSKYIKNWFGPTDLGKANSRWLAGLMIGPAVALPFFSWLIPLTGWRQSFFILGFISLLPLYFLWYKTSDTPRRHPDISARELQDMESGLAGNHPQEEVSGHRVRLNLAACMKNYRFWLLAVFSFCHASMWWGIIAWIPAYLKMERGFSWQALGLAAGIPYLFGLAALLLCGWLSDKRGKRAPFAAFSVLGAAAGLYFGMAAESHAAIAAALAFAVASLAVGLPSNYAILQRLAPTAVIGSATGLMNGVTQAGAALAPLAIGCFIHWFGSYGAGMLYLVATGVLGCLVMAVFWRQGY